MYRETVNIEQTLKFQISDAIDKDYLDELQSHTTNTMDDIPTILQYLFTNYGEVQPEVIKEAEHAIEDMAFTVSDPLTKLYTKIEDLTDLANVTSPYTNTQ